MRLVSVLLSILLIGGCVRSINPVLKDEQVREVPQLAGKWTMQEARKSQIEAKADGKQFQVSMVNEDGQRGDYIVRVGAIGELLVAEIRPADIAEEAAPGQLSHMVPVYSFAVLTETQPAIRARILKPDRLRDYAREHPQELPMAGTDDSEVLVATVDQLQAAIQKLWGQKEFWDEVVFVRPDAGPSK